MRMNTLTPEIKQHLIKIYGQYEEGKLTFPEEVQLFQDLWDTGLVFDMGPEVLMFAQRLLNVNLIKEREKPSGNRNAN